VGIWHGVEAGVVSLRSRIEPWRDELGDSKRGTYETDQQKKEKEQHDMKHLKIAGLCLVAMFAIGMAASVTASAAPVWEQCQTEKLTTTKYTTDQCTTASGGGGWAWHEVSGTEKVKASLMTLTVRDIKTPGGATAIRCDHAEGSTGNFGPGSIGPGNKGRVTEAKVKEPKTECTRLEGACKAGEVEEIEAVDLPWQTELFETEGRVLTKIESGGSGEPGWKVKCNTLLGSKTDTCESEAGKREEVRLENRSSKNSKGETELLILNTAERRHKQKCSEGGAEAGEVEGQGALLAENGSGLRIS
jgi:hypothetical protein